MSTPETARHRESPGSDRHHLESVSKNPRLSLHGGDDSDPLVPDALLRRATCNGLRTTPSVVLLTIRLEFNKREKRVWDRLYLEDIEMATLQTHLLRLPYRQIADVHSLQSDDRLARQQALEVQGELGRRDAFQRWLCSRVTDATAQSKFLLADIACRQARAAVSLVIGEPTESLVPFARRKLESARDCLCEAQSILDTDPRSDMNLADIAWEDGPDGPVLSPTSWLSDLDEEYYREEELRRRVEAAESASSGSGV